MNEINLLKPYTIGYRRDGWHRNSQVRLDSILGEIELMQDGVSIRFMPIQLIRDGHFDDLPRYVKGASNCMLPRGYKIRDDGNNNSVQG